MGVSQRDFENKGNWDKSCVFCRKIDEGDYDYERFKCVVFEPLNPVVPGGHWLVVPTLHTRDAADFPHVASWAFKLAGEIIHQKQIQANIITSVGPLATQSVFHCHIHVVERKKGDGLHLPWTNQRKG